MSDVRQALISSLFPASSGEKLIIHVKIWQDVQPSKTSKEIKGTPRYLCLTQKKSSIRLLKAKRNFNGAFSTSKTWALDDIKQIKIIDNHQFSIFLNKSYLWAVEKGREMMVFLAFLIDSCRRSATVMPKLYNIDEARILRFLADPSAPTMGSTITTTTSNDNNIHKSQSLRGTSSSNSSSSSSHYKSLSMSAHSINSNFSEIQYKQYARSSTPQLFAQQHNHELSPESPTYNNSGFSESPMPLDNAQNRAKNSLEIDRALKERNNMQRQYEEKTEVVVEEKIKEHAMILNREDVLNNLNLKNTGNAAAAEKILLDEYHALENANLQSVVQSEKQIKSIVEHIDRSLQELDNMENWLSQFTIELNINSKRPERA